MAQNIQIKISGDTVTILLGPTGREARAGLYKLCRAAGIPAMQTRFKVTDIDRQIQQNEQIAKHFPRLAETLREINRGLAPTLKAYNEGMAGKARLNDDGAVDPGMTIDGIQELLRAMDGLAHAVREEIIRQALKEAAKPIQRRIQALAPNDPKTPGSRIAKSISVQVQDKSANGAFALIGPTRKGFMARFAERGTKHQRATPFIAPGFDQTIEEAKRIMATVLGDGIDNAWRKK